MNVFPAKDIDVPIFGLDVVATPNKVSGCFCDYSPTNDSPIQKEYMDFFENITSTLEWKRERELPPWAQEIFSKNMIAAGAVKEGEEADQLCIVAKTLTDFYFNMLQNEKATEGLDTTEAQNKYCINQKMNKMLHTSLLAMGVEEGPKDDYVNNLLFEEI
jgi:phycocyanobilin:ferredoxin oxidoreductase